MVTIETELCKKLNISWADARDLASYARGKLDIIPGDTAAERSHRQAIIAAAIEADKQFPRKRRSSKALEPPRSDCVDSPECPKLDAGDQNIAAPKSNTMRAGRGNNVDAENDAEVAQEGSKSKADLGACTACMQCFTTLGHCCAIFSLC